MSKYTIAYIVKNAPMKLAAKQLNFSPCETKNYRPSFPGDTIELYLDRKRTDSTVPRNVSVFINRYILKCLASSKLEMTFHDRVEL